MLIVKNGILTHRFINQSIVTEFSSEISALRCTYWHDADFDAYWYKSNSPNNWLKPNNSIITVAKYFASFRIYELFENDISLNLQSRLKAYKIFDSAHIINTKMLSPDNFLKVFICLSSGRRAPASVFYWGF